MTTNAQLAAKLLRNAAEFFRSVGEQNPAMVDDMEQNAQRYELVADWVEQSPDSESDLSRLLDD